MKDRMIYRIAILIIAFLIVQFSFTQCLKAQVEKDFASKGTFEIGGNISYQYSTSVLFGQNVNYHNDLSFQSYFGYFIIDNFELGLSPLGIQKSWNSQDDFTTINILIAPAYNVKLGESIYYFFEAQAGYSTQIIAGSLAYLNPRREGFSWGGRTGLKVKITGKSLLNVGLQYQEITLTPKNASERMGSNNFMFSLGFSVWL